MNELQLCVALDQAQPLQPSGFALLGLHPQQQAGTGGLPWGCGTFGGSHCAGPVRLSAAHSSSSGVPSHGCCEYNTVAVPGGAEETQSCTDGSTMPYRNSQQREAWSGAPGPGNAAGSRHTRGLYNHVTFALTITISPGFPVKLRWICSG